MYIYTGKIGKGNARVHHCPGFLPADNFKMTEAKEDEPQQSSVAFLCWKDGFQGGGGDWKMQKEC